MDAERKVIGRPFKHGNPGGPGRPKRVHELRYLSIMHRLCTPATWAEITEKAIEQALAGDGAARVWLAKYTLPVECDPFAEIEGNEQERGETPT